MRFHFNAFRRDRREKKNLEKMNLDKELQLANFNTKTNLLEEISSLKAEIDKFKYLKLNT